eukprot:TRINITY_DN12604_c0_g1_i1.p1 TRINITY_DN12604_c0_g1~~TRINITY_DN12604_c0_g1_i1.p1  ORF type:complete len:210 (+),score=60.11 TRINITY_DN12604_c0_g1_i1:37-666(+)
MTSNQSLPKLLYFDHSGRGEAIRLAYVVTSTPFDDNRLSDAQWKEIKATTPWNTLPVLEVPGKGSIGQSLAALRYVGSTVGLYSNQDSFLAAQIDDLIDGLEDVMNKLVKTIHQEITPETLVTVELPKILGAAEKRLEKNSTSTYAFGDKLSIADLVVYVDAELLTSGIFPFLPKDLLSNYKRITAIQKTIGEIPQIKNYYSKQKESKS